MATSPARLYPNECVGRIIAFIPPGHMHARFILELGGEKIILHEAAVAGLVRAYTMVALHPTRRVAELVAKPLKQDERKQGFAEWQLVESNRSDDAVLEEALQVWREATPARCRGGAGHE